VAFVISPEHVRLIRKDGAGPDPARHRNLMHAVVVEAMDRGLSRILRMRLDAPGVPAQGDADLEVELSPLVYERLEIDRERQWQLSVQPAAVHVLADHAVDPPSSSAQPAGTTVPDRSDPRWAPGAAAAAGAAVGVGGGLLGLGGAEFRLPILVGYFRYAIHRAVALNLAVSFVTVLAAALTRLSLGEHIPTATAVTGVGLPLAVGGMLGAAWSGAWIGRVSPRRLHGAVKVLLIAIGTLLLVEASLAWEPAGLPLGAGGRAVVGLGAGLAIGGVSTVLGVAGGELIIPTLVFAFGLPIKEAGTLSLLISLPTMLVGLGHHRARGAFAHRDDLRRLVTPMSVGAIAGGIAGGLLVAHVPAALVKVLLGPVLILSAARVFGARIAGR
jgi:uncharacterized membrane protein YfcA